jgi:Protein of unknown function (DUF2628)
VTADDGRPARPPAAGRPTGANLKGKAELAQMSNLAEQEIRAFVGARADSYLEKWQPVLENKGIRTGFNWPAFLVSGIWLPYRKMYRRAAIFWGAILLATVLEYLIFAGILGQSEPPGCSPVGLIAAIVCGAFGNAWYLSHTAQIIAEVRSQGLTEDVYFQELAKRGGTSIAAAAGFLIGGIIAMYFVLFWSELLLELI